MAEYIDKQALIEGMAKVDGRKWSTKTLGEVLDAIGSIEIVRCKDCKHRRKRVSFGTEFLLCEKHRDYQREWRKRNPDYFKKWRAKEKAGLVKEKPEGFRHIGGVFTVDRCPICKTPDIGKIGKNNYYCPRCAVEFNAQHCWSITREGVRVREW